MWEVHIIKTASRILKAKQGTVYLDGKAIEKQPTKEIAKKMAILPQTAEVPTGLTVFELVSYGRFLIKRVWHVERRGLSLY